MYHFFSNPLDHLYSDPYRHRENAMPGSLGITFFPILDPPLPQFILQAAIYILGDTVLGLATYFGLLCVIIPWCWYLWGRLIFPSKTIALVFMAVITYLPSWTSIYSYVMDEPILLPSLGIALWLSWRAKLKMTIPAILLATLAWAFTMCVKLNVTFALIIVISWLLLSYFRQNNDMRKKVCLTLLVGSIIAIAYLSYGQMPARMTLYKKLKF